MVNKHRSKTGFTLVELLVVIIIVALLSALTLGALRSGGIRAKEDSTRSFVVHISDSLLELFEELDDQGFLQRITGPPYGRSYAIRWQLPTTRSDAMHTVGGQPDPPFGSTYNTHAQSISVGATESAQCLYMIMTQTGYFSDFVETLHERQVTDTDNSGIADVFIDAWGTPIRLEFTPAIPEPDENGNMVLEAFGNANQEDHNGNNVRDTTAVLSIQNLPIIRSAGVDLEFDTDDDIVSIDLVNEIFIQ